MADDNNLIDSLPKEARKLLEKGYRPYPRPSKANPERIALKKGRTERGFTIPYSAELYQAMLVAHTSREKPIVETPPPVTPAPQEGSTEKVPETPNGGQPQDLKKVVKEVITETLPEVLKRAVGDGKEGDGEDGGQGLQTVDLQEGIKTHLKSFTLPRLALMFHDYMRSIGYNVTIEDFLMEAVFNYFLDRKLVLGMINTDLLKELQPQQREKIQLVTPILGGKGDHEVHYEVVKVQKAPQPKTQVEGAKPS